MKLTITLLLAALCTLVSATAAGSTAHELKPVVVTYAPDTPSSVLEQAKDAIRKAGGMVTHEYHLIKGYAANIPDVMMGQISAMGKQWSPVIEEDQMVHAINGGSGS